jgi:PIN domain nuclease of toxin-antitoxin system
MRVLLDTHTFLWWDGDPGKLSARSREVCQNPENTLLLSTASVWEIQIKMQLGKLKVDLPLAVLIEQQLENGIEILPVQVAHVLELGNLPVHHKDPFDRLLNAQARIEDAAFMSADPVVAQYPVEVIW